MKINSFTKIALVLSMVCSSIIVKAQTKADTLAIQTILQDEIMAWNKGDAVAYSKQFASNGTFTNIAGMFYTGQKAFLDRHEEVFKGMFNKTALQYKIVSLHFVRPDVAVVETLCQVTGFATPTPSRLQLDAKGQLNTRLLQVLVRASDGWEIAAYHNVDLKPGVPVPEDK